MHCGECNSRNRQRRRNTRLILLKKKKSMLNVSLDAKGHIFDDYLENSTTVAIAGYTGMYFNEIKRLTSCVNACALGAQQYTSTYGHPLCWNHWKFGFEITGVRYVHSRSLSFRLQTRLTAKTFFTIWSSCYERGNWNQSCILLYETKDRWNLKLLSTTC